LEILDAKFVKQGFGPEEQLKHLKRAKRNGVKANVFFDFEASPFDRHEAYCGRYSEFNEAQVREARTGLEFLQELCAKYGKVDDGNNKQFVPPTIKLLAHNLTYDYAFIAPYLSRVQLVEKGTKIVCGTAHFSTVHNTPTDSPNAQVIEWLKNWENRIDLGLNDEKINSACCVLKKMTEFVGSPEAVDLCKGIGKPVKEAMKKNIPWGDFKPEPVERYQNKYMSTFVNEEGGEERYVSKAFNFAEPLTSGRASAMLQLQVNGVNMPQSACTSSEAYAITKANVLGGSYHCEDKMTLVAYRSNYYVQCLARLNISDGEYERILSGLDTRGSSADITLTTSNTDTSDLLIFLECSSTMRVGSGRAIEVVV
jgi:hypothetical protein